MRNCNHCKFIHSHSYSRRFVKFGKNCTRSTDWNETKREMVQTLTKNLAGIFMVSKREKEKSTLKHSIQVHTKTCRRTKTYTRTYTHTHLWNTHNIATERNNSETIIITVHIHPQRHCTHVQSYTSTLIQMHTRRWTRDGRTSVWVRECASVCEWVCMCEMYSGASVIVFCCCSNHVSHESNHYECVYGVWVLFLVNNKVRRRRSRKNCFTIPDLISLNFSGIRQIQKIKIFDVVESIYI